MGHGSFRESSSPRSPHLAPAQAPEQQPQLSVSSITSHLARTQRRPGANSQLSQPGAPTHVLEVAPPHSPAARLFPARARAQTAGLHEEGRERFPGSMAHAPRAPATSRRRPQVVDAQAPRRAHPRNRGRLPPARQLQTPRLLRGPQRLGPGGRRVHACLPAARRPGRRSAT